MKPAKARMESMGVLQLNEAGKIFRLERFAPHPQLSPFVRHYWLTSWDLRGCEPHLQHVIPNPCVNLVAEAHRCGIYGVPSGKYTKRLEGKGCAFGVKFNPGGFYPYYAQPLSRLTDGAVSPADVLGADGGELVQAVAACMASSELIRLTEAMLLERLPAADPTVSLVGDIVEFARVHSEVAKVEQLCEAFSLNIRKLQRLFSQYVGVSPKWVIRLYRLQNAAEAIDRGGIADWSELSQELGFYDQSHFIKSFKAIIGKTPDEYAKSPVRQANARNGSDYAQ